MTVVQPKDITMAEAMLRQIKIKVGVLKRAVKERELYAVEVTKERQRYDNMKETNCDAHQLGHQVTVIRITFFTC